MKKLKVFTFAIGLVILSCSCEHTDKMDNNFSAKKASRTATFEVNTNIEIAFPLFGAFEERKWAEGWVPILIYPSEEMIEEGTTFKTEGHGHGEKEFLWRVSKFEPNDYLIQYLVSTENRYWTITVKCMSLSENLTSIDVTYTFIGLNELGNKINESSIEKMYSKNLVDWQEAINFYLENGKMLKGN